LVERDAVADHLPDAALVRVALERADSVDEQLPVEMVDLVLQRDREQTVGLDGDLLLIEGPRFHQDLGAAAYLGGELHDPEPAFLPEYRAVALDDDGVDQS